MRQFCLCLFCLLIPWIGRSQFTNPDLQSMVNAEEAFIRMAKEKNTKEAFLFFLSDEAVTVGPNGPVIGKNDIRSRPANTNFLSWNVSYCDIASSGDLGYTAGPWEFRNAKTDSLPVAYGEFHSIWRKQSDGSWKNVADVGVSHDMPATKESLKTTSKPLMPAATKAPSAQAIVTLMKEENAFLESYKKNGLSAYKNVSSSEIRFTRQGELPIVTPAEKANFLKGANPYFNLALVDGGISSSGDMGYVYGTADAVVLIDDKQESKTATYLRVWKKEDGKNWKIVLDVLAYR